MREVDDRGGVREALRKAERGSSCRVERVVKEGAHI